jgi:uncharacterized protein YdbL (DUF1318 family)
MRTARYTIAALLAALAVLFLAQNLLADGIKDRMKARLPIITELKSQGLSGKKPQADVIKAENQDRREVYKAIAKRQNTTPEFVGQARAAQIADKEPSGFWVQDPGGAWKKK